MKIILILILLLSITVDASANNYDLIANEQQKKQQLIISDYASEVKIFTAQSNKRIKEIESHISWLKSAINKKELKESKNKNEKNSGVDQDKTTKIQNKNNERNEKILIFVSFSMPETSLRQWLKDAKDYRASVVIRGLKNNSFKDTALEVVKLLGKQENGNAQINGGIEINPLVFKEFGINKVPAVVKVNDITRDFDVIYGNITLEYALKVITNKKGVL